MKKFILLFAICIVAVQGFSQSKFNGLETNMSNLYRLSDAKTRSITPENFTGEKGKGGMAIPDPKAPRNTANSARKAIELGQGWKVNPFVIIKPKETFTLAEIDGPGAIQSIWMTPTGNWRFSILRIYWDDEEHPSVEVPVGDFFGMGWGVYSPLNSLAVCVNPGSAFNCYWNMPFRKKAKITIENIHPTNTDIRVYYQINYTLTDVPDDAAYFHAQFSRSNPNLTSLHTVVDDIKGKGHFVGMYMAYGVTNNGWWGEGEVKFFMDGDKEFPTICGTGLEDYFCGSYNFENKAKKEYEYFSTPYAGLHQIIKPDGLYKSQMRFGMYRWHIMDPIRFEKDLKVTVQDLGWRQGHGDIYLPQKSDISSVSYWYQTEPHATFPKLPSWQELEVN